MQIRCTKVDHLNYQILGICIESICQHQRPYCHFCLPNHSQHLNKLASLEQLNDWIYQRVLIIQNVQQNVQECKKSLDNLKNTLIPYMNFNIEQLSQIGLSQFDYLIKGLCEIESCEKMLLQQLQQSIEQIKMTVNKIIEKIKNQTNVEQNDNVQMQNSCKLNLEKQNDPIPLENNNLNSFQYELINQNSIKQEKGCYAIAINKDNSIVLTGYDNLIKVFENQQGNLNEIQLLSEHTTIVYTLNFMQKSNHFVSGSHDKLIIIWQMNENNLWTCQQKLYGHSHSIVCLLINNNENLIISSSFDNSIKFWNKQEEWQCQQTFKNYTSSLWSLSLNEQEDKLIACSTDSEILIIEFQQMENIWVLRQRIQVDYYGYRLSFINENLFTFQPKCKEQMYIYELNSTNKQFVKTKEINIKCDSNCCDNLFPQKYIKSKSILLNKNGNNINLLRKLNNGEFINVQNIQFGHYNIYGQLSDDGEYLISWDFNSKELQIRKYKEN
ncbi:unnamed protein product [Paramecium primaurelia]|uniref:WD40-repeat-containing domain n=1 Tax=Paramecium primaurelia TaxID=5886 RepID=A0A8S1PR94_PARPR|nr:unnamed protein product [Paramecium primaurelia]